MSKCTEQSTTSKRSWDEYREHYKGSDRTELREKIEAVEHVVFKPSSVNMKAFCGSELELAYGIEKLYANYGRYVLMSQAT